MPAIVTEALTKKYGRNRGITDVDLIVEEGEIFGFIGPNGAGKSTTIRLLLNFIFPTSGKASIFGMDVTRESAKIKKSVAYVPGEVNFYPEMRVSEILRFATSFYPGAAGRREKLCEILEVDVTKKAGQLSLGNKKKVSIVQALLFSPRLIILDEPTSGLDPLMQTRLFELLREENKNGATIFFSSHNLPEVQKFCNRVSIIRDGRIIETKKVEELVSGSMRRVKIRAQRMPEVLPQLGCEVRQEEGWGVFLYGGEVGLLLRTLASMELADVLIEEPTLNELFLEYYQAEGEELK